MYNGEMIVDNFAGGALVRANITKAAAETATFRVGDKGYVIKFESDV